MAARQPILMPKLGLTMTEGVLTEWKVAPGDQIKAGDVIFIVETDKISNEIEASEDGVIEELRAAPGDEVPVGQIVATLVASAGGSVAKPEAVAMPTKPAAAPTMLVASTALAKSTPSEALGRVIATPLARRRAEEAGLDIASISGSGPRGRITADDVAAAIKPQAAPSDTAPAPTARVDGGVIRQLGAYQAVTARRLTEAKRDIPHFYIFAEADVTDLIALRERLNATPSKAKITFNHFIITAVARALTETPAFNCVWTPEGALEFARVDIGLAVEGPKGLVAPVLRDLGERSVEEVAEAATRLVATARAGRLSSKDLQGGAITISNVGMFGATGLLPIINPGQSSILGIGRSQSVFRPDARNQPQLRHVLGLSLSCDHRVIDGALAARFLQSVQHGLEAPSPLSRESQGS